MAALVLSVAGGAAGAVFGPAGAIAGRIVGALAGNMIDQALFGSTARSVTGPRLADLDVMASTEGAPIPRLYGRARLSGQVIWATRLEEVVSTSSQTTGGKGGLGGATATTTTTTYSYYANFAVGLCEGEIGSVGPSYANRAKYAPDGPFIGRVPEYAISGSAPFSGVRAQCEPSQRFANPTRREVDPKLVTTLPGWNEYAETPVPCSCTASSRIQTITASFAAP